MTCKGELNLHLFITIVCRWSVVGIATRYELARGSNPGGAEIFRNLPDQLWGSPSLLHNDYQDIAGSKAAEKWCQPPTPSRTEVKERVKLYLYSPLGLRGLFWGELFAFTFTVSLPHF